ncbi:MAG: hypothetical protein M0Q21_04995 [Ignavibacteriaceae bacterium]|nr:hypothetical protein [Ignavibacteriaceae bacterium]
MSIPQNGNVIIVDDQLENEALPLMKALSQEGISYSYYSGRLDELPIIPRKGIRLLFLDLKLEGIPGTFDSNDIVQSVKPVVERLISINNGPYIILGWTDTPGLLKVVVESLHLKPLAYISMDKSECLSSPFPLRKIKKKLHQKILTLGKIGLIFQWENFANESAYLTTNSLLDIVNDKEKLSDVLYKISEAYLGEHIKDVKPIVKKRALFYTLNNFLQDTARKNIIGLELRKYNDLVLSNNPVRNHLSKLNAKFLINSSPNKIIIPGNIYLSHNMDVNTICKMILSEKLEIDQVKKDVNKELSKNAAVWSKLPKPQRDLQVETETNLRLPSIIREFKKIFLEITPVCDFSQNNFMVHRVVSGLLFPARLLVYLKENSIEGAYYISKKFFYEKNSEEYQFLIYFRGFLTLPKKELKKLNPLISLNQELLFDIQHRVGNHMSRPGVLTVS